MLEGLNTSAVAREKDRAEQDVVCDLCWCLRAVGCFRSPVIRMNAAVEHHIARAPLRPRV